MVFLTRMSQGTAGRGHVLLNLIPRQEQTNQVWTSCADVTIKPNGQGTKPFSPVRGCDICCPEKQLPCSNCTGCMHDKTGPCAYCWNPLPGYNPDYAPPPSCLGHEASVGPGVEQLFATALYGIFN